MKPVIQSLVEEGWILREVDAYRETRLTQRWNVDRLPTMIVLVDGEEVDRLMGEASEAQVRTRLAQFAPSVQPRARELTIDRPNETTTSNGNSTAGPFPALDATTYESQSQQVGVVSSDSFKGQSAPRYQELSSRTNNTTSAVSPSPISDPMTTTVRIRVDEGSSFAFGLELSSNNVVRMFS